jgi:hypothetical protein
MKDKIGTVKFGNKELGYNKQILRANTIKIYQVITNTNGRFRAVHYNNRV